MSSSARPVTVALDLLGGDRAPESVVEGAVAAVTDDPGLAVVLVGPVDVAEGLLGDHAGERLTTVAASQVIGMDEDPARAVRAKRDATVRVAARLVRDGTADACVSVGSTGAAMAASLFTLGRLPGVTRPALALVIPAARGPLVLLDVGATVEAGPDLLAQFGLAGAAYAATALDLPMPRVGLLSVGSEAGKGDPLRKESYDALAAALDGLPAEFVGNVEGGDVAQGGVADVVVTDGFTGNVLLKGMEGMLGLVGRAIRGREDPALTAAFEEAVAALDPERLGGAMLLGVDGVSVVGHGASSARAVASCVQLAARAVSDGLVPRVAERLAELVSRRRVAAGLDA